MGKTSAFSITIKLGIIAVLCTSFLLPTNAVDNNNGVRRAVVAPDSIGTEVINDEINIIHRVAQKETYYALSRRYNIPVNRIMEVNNKKSLKPGDTVKIPTGLQEAPSTTIPSRPTPEAKQQDQSKVLTEYKVGKKETLYAISRRFGTTIGAIKSLNDLPSDSLQEGMTLKIPNADYREPIPEVAQQQSVIMDTSPTTEPLTPEQLIAANRYGIREKQEKGIGVWINDLETDGQSNLALHKTAPVGTILKITNPMTRNVTYAKVVGKFTDTAETKDAIVVLSKSAAAFIGALDRRFLIEIAYGVPLQ